MALGGRTVHELQQAMSLDEFHYWLMYRAKWGISTLRGVEYSAALTAQATRGGKFEDYLPNRGEAPTLDEPVSIAQAMAILGGTVRKG